MFELFFKISACFNDYICFAKVFFTKMVHVTKCIIISVVCVMTTDFFGLTICIVCFTIGK